MLGAEKTMLNRISSIVFALDALTRFSFPRIQSIRSVDPVAFEPSSAGALLFSSQAPAIAVAVGYVRRMNYANARRSAFRVLERTFETAARAEHDLTEKRQFYFHSSSVPIRTVMQHMTGSISLRAKCTRSARSDERRQT